MLTNDEFKKWCGRLNLSDSTIGLISNIRDSDPSRRVGGGNKNVSGAYPSKKMGMAINFESHTVELPGLYLKEYDDDVLEMYDQPPQIKLLYKSIKEKVIGFYHTPDFFVLHKDIAGWEEWKTEEELCKLAEESPNRYALINGVWRCPPGEMYAKQFGLHYWVKSSKLINWTLQRNITFLEDYILDAETELSQKAVNKVLLYIRSNPGTTLINTLDISGVQADDIYYMIARKIIYVDLERGLLSEPEYTHVFINEESSLSFQTFISNKKVPEFADNTIEVSPGAKIIWEGEPWTIVNLGSTNISLLADDRVVNIEKEQFYKMVCQGQIKDAENKIIKSINNRLNSILAEASEEELSEANKRYKIIAPIIEGSLNNRDVGELEVTQRTLRNWINSYKQAEQQYGSGYIGLIPHIKKRGNRTCNIPDTTLNALNVFLDENENVKNQSKKVLYGKFCIRCDKEGIIPPSMKSFNKIINLRPQYERTLWTEGSRVAYQKDKFYYELDMTTPRHGERPFEIAHIDHTQIDLQLINSKTGKPMGKPWLTMLVDAYSRRVLSFYITFDAPSYRSNMMVIRECVRRFNRLPQIIVMDNGRDFKSTYFQSLLSYFQITYKIRPPHKARFGSVGERLFGTTMSQLIHNLQGNTKIMKNVRQVTKSVNPVNHAVWTLPKLYDLLKEYFYELYDTSEHSSLGESPREAFERGTKLTGKRPFRFIPYDEDFRILTLPAIRNNNGTAKVDLQRGVKVNYTYFYCDELYTSNVAGTYISVRYDPWDMGIVYCFFSGRWLKCYSQFYQVFKGRSESEIKIASQELLRQKKTHAGKSSISARQLADFIMLGEASEQILNQRFKDVEMLHELNVINGDINVILDDESEMEHEIDENENAEDENMDNVKVVFNLDDDEE